MINFLNMKQIGFGVIVILALWQLSGSAVAAPQFLVSESDMVTIDSPMTDDTYAIGGEVVVDKPVQGDLVVMGGKVEVNANVSGDIWVLGGTVVVRGNVGDDLRVGGGEVSLYSVVSDDVLVGAGELVVGQAGLVRGDLLAGVGRTVLDGKVLGDIKVAGGEIMMKGVVTGDAELRTDSKISFAEGSRVEGVLQYWSSDEIVDAGNYATTVKYHKITTSKWGKSWLNLSGLTAMSIAWVAWKWLGMMLLGIVLILWLPKFLPKTAKHLKENHWTATWYGLLVIVVIPVVAFVAIMTLIGIPIAVALGCIYGLLWLFGGVVGSYFVGHMIVRHDKKPAHQFGALALGVAIAVTIGALPVIGWLAKLWIVLVGVGGIVQEKRKLAEDYR